MSVRYNDINYYESEFYKIQIYQNKYKDIFYFDIDVINRLIIVERIDIDKNKPGWGQNLQIIVRNKIFHNNEIITIGPSDKNILNINFNVDDINNIDESLINHYENEFFKIFYVSKNYNDIFKINYDTITKVLDIKRLDDKNSGWGDSLILKYKDKITNKEKLINIGLSKKSEISIIIDVELLDYRSIDNYFESNNYIITLFEFKFLDKFTIIFYEENNTIYIKRIDTNEGWGAKLMLNFVNKNNNENQIIYIGDSKKNEIYSKIDLKIKKCYISLTTIPSRIVLPVFYSNIMSLLNNQTYSIEKIFITIAKKYKRFTETIDYNIIEKLKLHEKINIIILEEDLGPASKYLAPLINYYDELKDNILVIVDDDRIYNKNLVRNFVIGFNSHPNITFSSGYWKEYFDSNYQLISDDYLDIHLFKEMNINKFYFGNGLGGFYGFALKVNNLENFIQYNLKILEKLPLSFYHDEGIILGYLKYKEETIMYLNHKGCQYIKNELVDALCDSNLVDRGKIEKEILQITNLEKLL
jgi:hypothetical protein